MIVIDVDEDIRGLKKLRLDIMETHLQLLRSFPDKELEEELRSQIEALEGELAENASPIMKKDGV